ncbi:DNA-formamidopyrimidine glycosylase [Erythrobacter arachoides]|uniref:DNA-formamidopyrimidine glycosylase n=1 Tax=Aurantiacibacter arachoides TaxID=1850444 RepID=A0A845A0W7_9SPHN|nr:Fpg/Nei family DNA glycosylase [Aurantiacibacter arachoides]MXO93364.1 DNA-formamidopyrimidine glycosylase [Aurantiacibacter arachoides]GGD49954.1 formamidopyrimidine-DNA glycosylase [Aurantiacibacter arachoides]
MPELPEAQANRRRIEDQCLNRTITSVELGDDVSYIELPGDNERQRLVGHRFTQTHRHGKLIFAGSKTGPWICVHLGMTGKLLPFDVPDEAPDHTKLLIAFEGDRRLAFRCPRKLGWVRVIDSPEAEIARIGFGPDALDVSREDFRKVMGRTRGTIKGALMAQRKLAGIGNLWSDEILFQTGWHPETVAGDIGEDDLGTMFDTMRAVLAEVCGTGAVYSKLPKDWLIGDRKAGKSCPRCEGTIAKAKVGGRSAYYCDVHQARR